MTEGRPPVPSTASGASRIVLGTVQLGLPYGRRHDQPTLDEATATVILERAWSQGIRAFDTAECYGKAASRLSTWLETERLLAMSHIVTKLSVEDAERDDRVEEATRRFDGAASITVLTHGAAPLPTFERFKAICDELGVIAGQSVYTAKEIAAASHAGTARVQAPVNVLDLRQLNAARECGLPLDARSVYLQGVLLDDPSRAEDRVPSVGPIVRDLHDLANSCGLTPAEALLAAVLAHAGPHDRVVLGADEPDQIDVVSRALAIPAHRVSTFLDATTPLRSRAAVNPHILDPRRWNA